jgi:DNA (cytosine-5)-methyltransferase 1
MAATLFSGIGAPEVAMPAWEFGWHAEIEKFPAAVMAERQPHSVNLGDVTAHDFTDRALAVGRPDVLVFGSPCQSFSVAGKRLGLDDARGNLALVALGIVARTQPPWFVFENVPGLLSSADGRDFGLFLRAVDDLGYHLAWTHLDAQYFGVAQRRRRLFAVGHLGDWRGPAAVLFEPQSLCGHPPTRGEAGEDVAASVGTRAAQGSDDLLNPGGLHIGAPDSGAVWPGGAGRRDRRRSGDHQAIPERAHALTTSNQRIDYETETLITHALSADGFDASEDGTGRGTPLVPVVASTLKNNHGGGGFGSDPSETFIPISFSAKDHGADAGDLAPTLRSGNHTRSHANGGVMPAVAFAQNSRDELREMPYSGALSAEPGMKQQTYLRGESGVRRLTPRECERLQGFPDDYTLIRYRGKWAKDGPRYKAIGNSMAVPVIRWILTRLEIVDALMRRPSRQMVAR